MIRLGYACTNMTLGRTFLSLRLATLRKRGIPYLQLLVNENLALLADILRWNRLQQIQFFRISSDLIPLGSHEEVDISLLTFAQAAEISTLAQGMRLSMHPGQYTLPSASGAVWQRSFRDLWYHACVLDQLGIVGGDLILHGGGVYGDRPATAARIIKNISSLPDSVRRRLRLENDERCWSIQDLLPVCEVTRTPLVVDNLHHALNGREQWEELPWDRILATWHGQRPKLHYSEQDPTKRDGAHSAYLHADSFKHYISAIPAKEYDVMLECKAKDLALLQLRTQLAASTESEIL
jgi:UV DNA damage endonuclease